MTLFRYVAAAAFAAAALTACGAPPALSTPSCAHLQPPILVSPAGINIPSGVVKLIVGYPQNPTTDWSNIVFDPEDGSAPFYGGPYTALSETRYEVIGMILPHTSEKLLVTQRSCGVAQIIGTLTSQ